MALPFGAAHEQRAVIDRLDLLVRTPPGGSGAAGGGGGARGCGGGRGGEPLRRACAAAIERVTGQVGERPGSVVRVRELDVELLLLVADEPDRSAEEAAAGHLADGIAQALGRVLVESSPARVRRFEDAAA